MAPEQAGEPSWSTAVPQECWNLGEAAGARRSICPDLMRGGAKQLLAAVACPYRANPRGPPRRQSYWRVRLRPVARQGPAVVGVNPWAVGAWHPRPMRWPDILSMSSSRCVIVSRQYGALAQFYVSGRPSVIHSHNYVQASSRAHTDPMSFVLCDWASTGHPLECAAAAHAPAGAAEGRSQPRERLEAWQLAARESHRSSRPGLTRRGPSWRWHSSAACRAADLGAAAERRLQPHGHCCCSSRCRRARPRTTSTRRRPCCERLAPGALPA